MGITNFTGWIKATDGVKKDQTKRCEVNLSSMIFALVNALSFHETVEFVAKSARRHMSNHATTSTHQTSSGPERAADADDAGMSTHTTTSTQQALCSPKRAVDVEDEYIADTASSNKRLRPLQLQFVDSPATAAVASSLSPCLSLKVAGRHSFPDICLRTGPAPDHLYLIEKCFGPDEKSTNQIAEKSPATAAVASSQSPCISLKVADRHSLPDTCLHTGLALGHT
ncbi:hypothetical protein KI688_002834 [Linnemannia hyalina]|uniref:Uncharacterized protein n=1 Tax=Linnemannia hyalina TaxID=64524 RepID=A0A9P7XRV7_9FUNG|nr:hypothetical protein KI688_002834 [Linnemannia hyalina]